MGNFCVVEEGGRNCSFTYMYLAQASTGRPLSPAGKNRFISRATFVTWQKWGEVHARGLHHIHILTVGVGKFQTYGTYKELCQHHFNWQTLSPMYSICKVEKNSSSCIKHRPMLNIYLSLSLSTATPYIKKTWHIMIFFLFFRVYYTTVFTLN